MNANQVLKEYFGYDSFRAGQEKIINTILSGQDALAIMPTGAGKSICYQVPALLLPGITIVISPLISLMQDQVKALNNVGIHAAYINSSLSEAQITKALDRASKGIYKIVYVAPERLTSLDFVRFSQSVEISMVTVDEAHCISQWGQDFRPSYLKIIDLIKGLKKRPIVSAFTATATEEVKTDIECSLNLNNPNIVVTGFDRENLYYRVETITAKEEFVVDFIDKHINESGIIYCATRKNVDKLYEVLLSKNVPVTKYHAGLDNETRKRNQEDFIYDRTPIIVATNAFGMGIDKSNVRYVIHYNMPQSMENYYQEAGRAGRDGELSQCILLFSVQDIVINKFLLEKKEFNDVETDDVVLIQQRDLKRLQVMEGYCRTTSCLRQYILNYFGEKTIEPCDNCGNCHREYKEVDMTDAAKWILNCVAETKGRYGLSIVIGTLLGAKRARLKELGTIEYKSYGKLENYSEQELRLLINQLIIGGYLYLSAEEYSVLKMGDISPLKDSDRRIIVKMYEEKETSKKQKRRRKRGTDQLTSAGFELFDNLRKLRLIIAREDSLPPYVVFSDKTLIDMCVKVPQNKEQMLNVSGVGNVKFEKYGQRFLDAIVEYLTMSPDVVTSLHEENAVVTAPKKRQRKVEFYINPEDAVNFVFKDLYCISEIKDELNRITTGNNVKKVTVRKIWEHLLALDLVEERNDNVSLVKTYTVKGMEMGIKNVQKISQSGLQYTLLMYPQAVQELIVDYFIRIDYER